MVEQDLKYNNILDLENFLKQIKNEEIKYENLKLLSPKILTILTNIKQLLEKILNIFIKNDIKIPFLFKINFIKLSKEYLNNLENDEKEININLLNKSLLAIDQLLDNNKESIDSEQLKGYFYLNKTKNAFLVGDDSLKSKVNIELMKMALDTCGYNCFSTLKLEDFKDYLNRDFTIGDNFVDFIFYYTGTATIIDQSNDILFNENTKLTDIYKLLNEKENEIKNLTVDKLKETFINDIKSIDNSEKDKLKQLSLFKIDYKKLFILDIINDKDIKFLTNSKKLLLNNENTCYLYSNIPKYIDNYYNSSTTIFTQSLLDRIYSDIEKNNGRNIPSIAKIIQYELVDKLNLLKPSRLTTNTGDDSTNAINFEKDIKSIKDIYGSNINELLFGKVLLNCCPVIYGDASVCDFLIFNNNKK